MWQAVWDWLEAHPGVWTTLVSVSVGLFLATLIAVPMLVVRVPADYFVRPRRGRSRWSRAHPAAWLVLMVLKNGVGVVLVAAGLAMLVLPGQGLVTILIGLMLCNFPGKFRLERWLVRRPPVRRAIDWVRRKAGRPVLVLDDPTTVTDVHHP